MWTACRIVFMRESPTRAVSATNSSSDGHQPQSYADERQRGRLRRLDRLDGDVTVVSVDEVERRVRLAGIIDDQRTDAQRRHGSPDGKRVGIAESAVRDVQHEL